MSGLWEGAAQRRRGEEGLAAALAMQDPGSGLPASRTVICECVLFKPSSRWFLGVAAQARTALCYPPSTPYPFPTPPPPPPPVPPPAASALTGLTPSLLAPRAMVGGI